MKRSFLYSEIKKDLATIQAFICAEDEEHADQTWRDIRRQIAELAGYCVDAKRLHKERDREDAKDVRAAIRLTRLNSTQVAALRYALTHPDGALGGDACTGKALRDRDYAVEDPNWAFRITEFGRARAKLAANKRVEREGTPFDESLMHDLPAKDPGQ